MNYQLLLECYRSNQMSEAQWQKYLEDNLFVKWLKKKND